VIGLAAAEPDRDCELCPRLCDFRALWRLREPTWFNAPVPSFGPREARLLIVGLAPGLRGANRTGRPFTGDYAGDLLYATLNAYGFASGDYAADLADGLELIDCRISNAVRCVPPENKPTGAEIATCRVFLVRTLLEMRGLEAIIALGRIAHESILTALGVRRGCAAFAHGRAHALGRITLYDSYHCSRYNTNTGKLTPRMFQEVFAAVRSQLDVLDNGPPARTAPRHR
jgi:uracil-DNA glycosylase family 4